jgi:hypothetical protein
MGAGVRERAAKAYEDLLQKQEAAPCAAFP